MSSCTDSRMARPDPISAREPRPAWDGGVPLPAQKVNRSRAPWVRSRTRTASVVSAAVARNLSNYQVLGSLRRGFFFFSNGRTSAGWSPAVGGSLVTRVVKSNATRCLPIARIKRLVFSSAAISRRSSSCMGTTFGFLDNAERERLWRPPSGAGLGDPFDQCGAIDNFGDNEAFEIARAI